VAKENKDQRSKMEDGRSKIEENKEQRSKKIEEHKAGRR
jgi:hypothetical protein